MGRKTKNALWEFSIKGGNNEVLMDDIECFDEHKSKIYGRNISELDDISVNDDEEIILLNKKDLAKKKKTTLVEYLYFGILCVIVMLVSRPASTHNLAHKRNMENHSKQTLEEFLILIL
ncbi:hypothetical protein Tco_0744680 [Tanacetum coccineum]